MHFARSTLVAFVTQTLLVLAQNTINLPPNLVLTPGESLQFKWTPTTDGPVSLSYHDGPSPYKDGDVGTPIFSGEKNDGSYTWVVPSDVVRGAQYYFDLVDDKEASKHAYWGPFTIRSDNTAAPSTSTATSTSADSSTSAVTVTTTSHRSTSSDSSTSDSTSRSRSHSTTTSLSSTSSTSSADGDAVITGQTATETGAAAQATRGVCALAAVAIGALIL